MRACDADDVFNYPDVAEGKKVDFFHARTILKAS